MKRSFLYTTLFSILLAGILLFTGCDSTDAMGDEATIEGQDEATIEGQLVNTTDRPVRNATVSISGSNQTTTTNDQGEFELSGVAAGSYTLTFEAAGYNSETTSVSIDGQNVSLGSETLRGAATISGQVLDAQTGAGAEDATVIFVFNNGGSGLALSAMVGDDEIADLVITTDANGNYTANEAPTGSFRQIIRRDGYAENIVGNVDIGEGENQLDPQAISEQLQEGELRIVLSWGESPRDLDAHLTGPQADGSRFHVYFGNRRPGGSNAELDRDDTRSYGPETITITALRDGMYRYSVHNYSNQSNNGGVGIYESPTEVRFYDESGLVNVYVAPEAEEGDGNTWRVLEFTVSGSTITLDDAGGDTFGYRQATGVRDMDTFLRTGSEKAPVLSDIF